MCVEVQVVLPKRGFSKNRVVERFLPKNRCDQVILDPIQNYVPARFALYEAALFEALLYIEAFGFDLSTSMITL